MRRAILAVLCLCLMAFLVVRAQSASADSYTRFPSQVIEEATAGCSLAI